MNVVAGGLVVPSKEVVTPPSPPPSSYFRANELDLGAFATYGTNTDNQSNFRRIGDRAWGGGAEVSYFPLFWAGLRVQEADCVVVTHRSAIGKEGSIPVLYANHETPFYDLGKDENGLCLFTDKIGGRCSNCTLVP